METSNTRELVIQLHVVWVAIMLINARSEFIKKGKSLKIVG